MAKLTSMFMKVHCLQGTAQSLMIIGVGSFSNTLRKPSSFIFLCAGCPLDLSHGEGEMGRVMIGAGEVNLRGLQRLHD